MFISFKWSFKHYFVAISCSIIILAWIIYVRYYNIKYNQYYYLTTIKPIWKIDRAEIKEVLNFVWNYWYSKYYYQSTFHLFLAIFLTFPYFAWKKISDRYTRFILFIFLGLILYILLFYVQFKNHDYYFIAMIPGISLLIVFALKHLMDSISHKWFQIASTTIVIVITLLSINYSREKLLGRHLKSIDKQSIIGFRLNGIESFVDSLGIDKTKRFLILGDHSLNGGLFFLKRHGWSFPNIEGENEKYFRTRIMETDYLLVTHDQRDIFNKKDLYSLKNKPIYRFRGNYIVKIR